jgi:hypothetical protein
MSNDRTPENMLLEEADRSAAFLTSYEYKMCCDAAMVVRKNRAVTYMSDSKYALMNPQTKAFSICKLTSREFRFMKRQQFMLCLYETQRLKNRRLSQHRRTQI